MPGVLHPSEWRTEPRRIIVLAAGLGAIPALASGALAGKAARRMFLAAPVMVPRTAAVWPLGPNGKEGPIPGYSGEWLDLLSVSLGEGCQPRSADRTNAPPGWDSLTTALTDPALIVRLQAQGQPATPEGPPVPRVKPPRRSSHR